MMKDGMEVAKLTPKQDKAVFLLASGKVVAEVAEQLEVDRTTLWVWRQQPAFEAILNQTREETKQAMQDGLRSLHQQALQTLRQSLDSGNEVVALKAALAVLDRMDKASIGPVEAEAIAERNILKRICHLS